MGPGSPDPQPTFCITVGGDVVGWVDYDADARAWLTEGQVNMGYALHADHRGHGHATRAMKLLLHHLALETDVEVATLLISPQNRWSIAIAERLGFARQPDIDGEVFFTRSVPPLTYTDGVVTIRPPTVGDAEAHTAAVDDEQIDWLWLPGQREEWERRSPDEQLDHQRRFLQRTADEWGSGPKWWFVIEHDGAYAGHVDADLANPNVSHGEANISYSMHPDLRGRGLTSRAVRLVLRFLADHTGAREAHLVVDPANEASQRVLRAVGGPVIPITR
jgi:RimJ/RimL family protein N-acetyltransferase